MFFLSSLLLPAQQNASLNRGLQFQPDKERTENQLNKDSLSVAGCFKPYIIRPAAFSRDKKESWLKRKLKKESLIAVQDSLGKYGFAIDPLLNFEFARDREDTSGKNLYNNTRGVLIRGNIGKDFAFASSFYENQSVFPEYISRWADAYLVVPGQGRWKKFKKNGYDYAMAEGYVSYSPSRYFNFQAGHGKHFVGEGYRSLLLSDYAFSYPFLRITSAYKNFQYTNLYAALMNFGTGGAATPPNTEPLFQKKAGSFQFLSWSFLKRFQLGLFQGMIWEASDTSNTSHLDANFFNPLILVNALQYGLNRKYNVLLGSTLKINLAKSLYFYGQYMLDDVGKSSSIRNKQGYQAGIKYLDMLGISNLNIQLEYNQARPYSYSHANPEQSYSHYNQALAHPLGANFREGTAFFNYNLKDFFLELKYNYSVSGRDSVHTNYGSNLFNSNHEAFYGINSTENRMGQGIKTTIRHTGIHFGYRINPASNLNIVTGLALRKAETSRSGEKTMLFFIAIRTSLNNIYYDF